MASSIQCITTSRPQTSSCGLGSNNVEKRLRKRLQNEDWNLCEAGGTQQPIFSSFSTHMPQKIGFDFGHPLAKPHYHNFRNAVKEHLPFFFIQIVDVHLFFANTSESFRISPSRNTDFISSKAQGFRNLCHNELSCCLDRF